MNKEKRIEKLRKLRPFKVFAIEKGTVIDHIPAGKALLLLKVLKLPENSNIVTVGLNFKSKKSGLKDIIKVEGKELSKEEINQVAMLVSNASINIIRDFKVAKKFKAKMPRVIDKLMTCPNPSCITSHEDIVTKFYPVEENNNIFNFKCHYCERVFSEEEIINEINNNKQQ